MVFKVLQSLHCAIIKCKYMYIFCLSILSASQNLVS